MRINAGIQDKHIDVLADRQDMIQPAKANVISPTVPADDPNAAIRLYDPQKKTVSTLLGRGHGDPEISLKRPHGVCIEQGVLYVVDTENHRVLKVEQK